MDDKQKREHQFMLELTALTLKHGVSIGGCGCCGSPWLDSNADISDERAGYSMSDGEVRWIAPSNNYDWERYSAGIIHEGSNAIGQGSAACGASPAPKGCAANGTNNERTEK